MGRLVVLMYHRVGRGKHSNSLEMLEEHFQWLKEKCEIVLPGDNESGKKLSVCLTFDDATYDFYHFVFPLLKKHNIRALLGVATRYILENTDKSAEERLNVPYTMMMQDGIFETLAPFCTWKELEEMVRSGFVEVASHSFSHPNLTFPFVNLEREVVQSKQMLEERLPQGITSFIYPFGKVNATVDRFVKQYYGYSFRIGSAMHKNWQSSYPFCRVPADHLRQPNDPITFPNLACFITKGFVDSMKNRFLLKR